jgi:hypothetical protein
MLGGVLDVQISLTTRTGSDKKRAELMPNRSIPDSVREQRYNQCLVQL